MGMTRRGSPALFAGSNLLVMIICLFISIEMGYAWWPNICTPGDTYIERNHINLPQKCGSSVCYDWCKGQCSSIGRSVAKKNCQDPPPYMDCQCCCDVSAPTPGSPPSPSLPPAPPSPPPTPSGKWPDGSINTKICAIGQEYVQIKHDNINDCALKPQCENKCKEKGLMSGGSQCIGSSRDYKGGAYSWYEQCCCAKIPPPPPPSPPPPPPPSPPPPSPSPPPPSPPPPSPSPPTPCPSPSPGSCCDKDINIKISVKSGGCNAEVSKTVSSSTGGTWAEL